MQHVSRTNVIATCKLIVALGCLILFPIGQAHAVWYETKGQALIVNGDKDAAKKKATQDALKQALLFAGASIHSVQKLTNGLLENEETTIRTTGEVEQVEIVNEIYSGDVVTVTVRADIFAKSRACKAQNDEKHFATTRFLIRNRQQLTLGNIAEFDEAFTQRLATTMQEATDNLKITYVAPHTTQFDSRFTDENIRALSSNGNTQFVIIGSIDDLSAHENKPSLFTSWRNNTPNRAFSMSMSVYDGVNGGQLFTKVYRTQADWTFDRFETVDEFSPRFWQSLYGKAIDSVINDAIQDIQASTACQPVTGRVLNIAGDIISISLGRDNGINVQDEMVLYQSREIFDSLGRKYVQYVLYPGTFVVENTFGNSSVVVNKNSGLTANIQENDFVVKK